LDECGLGATPVLANDVIDLLDVTSLRFPAGFDDGFEAGIIPERAGLILSYPVLPGVETQEVEADLSIVLIERVDDAGLAGLQGSVLGFVA
jgi:hypothetical protein